MKAHCKVILKYNNLILLIQQDKKDLWEVPSCIIASETVKQASIRAVKNTLNVKLRQKDVIHIGAIPVDENTLIYFSVLKLRHIPGHVYLPPRYTACKWVYLSEVFKENLDEDLRKFLHKIE